MGNRLVSAPQGDQAIVLITDLHRRITGVSATIRNLVPLQSSQHNVRLWSRLPLAGHPRLSFWKVLKLLRRKPRNQAFHIWHARRNNEMLWALLFKYLFRCPLRIVFTSAAIRRHSCWPRWLIRRMDAVIATSSRAAELVDHVTAVVGHGVDVDRFQAVMTRGQALTRLNVPFERAIGQFGRVRPEKGSDYFVRTMIELLPNFPDYGALLVGKVQPRFVKFNEDLKKEVRKAGLQNRIVWLGEVPFCDIPAIYNAMDIVVAPSRYEGFGLTPIEAMATGAPVVAADTGAYKQMIDQGETGYVFPVGDQPQFKAYVGELMEDREKRDAMATACRHKVVAQFSIEKEAAGIAAVYETVWAKHVSK